MFNKGLDVCEKQGGLLKKSKNIEDKTDNQLDLTKNQGDRQLDLISKTKDTMFIGHSSERMNRLRERVNREDKTK